MKNDIKLKRERFVNISILYLSPWHILLINPILEETSKKALGWRAPSSVKWCVKFDHQSTVRRINVIQQTKLIKHIYLSNILVFVMCVEKSQDRERKRDRERRASTRNRVEGFSIMSYFYLFPSFIISLSTPVCHLAPPYAHQNDDLQ